MADKKLVEQNVNKHLLFIGFSAFFSLIWAFGLIAMIYERKLELFAWAGSLPIVISLIGAWFILND